MALTTTLNVTRGDSAAWNVTVTLNGAAFALAGANLRFTVKKSPNDADADALIKRSTGAEGGVSISDAANGKARITIDPSHTTGLDPGTTYVWDMQITTTGGAVYTPDGLRGPFTVTADVSRTTP